MTSTLGKTFKSIAREVWFARDRVRFQRYVEQSNMPVILCYTMGKVGSTSIYRSLKQTKYANGVLHLHFLNPLSLPVIRDAHRKAGFKSDPAHLKASSKFNKFRSTLDPRRLNVIMAVRDPIAFAISDFFQNPYLFADFNLSLTEDNAAEIESYLVNSVLTPNSSSFSYWNNWFATEMESVFDFNFADYALDRGKGWSVISANNMKIGFIQLEKLSIEFSNLTMSLLGEQFQLQNRISRDRSKSQGFYSNLVKRISLPDSHLNEIYGSPMVRHFYSDTQIRDFINKWR